MKDHFAMMAAYNAWANARVYAEARALPADAYRRSVGAFFGSLHGTLNHLLTADRIWMRRFTGEGDAPTRLDAILCEDLASLRAAREAEDARIAHYVATLTEKAIAQDFPFTNTKGVAQCFPLGEVLAHFFNHQTHHRGQAHCILTILGVAEPAPLDLMAMQRELADR